DRASSLLHRRLSSSSLGDTFDKTGLDRQLGGGKPQRFAGNRHRNAVYLEKNPAWLHAHDPKLRRALALAHAHFDRLFRNRHVRIHANPDPARALHEARERAARGFDLTRSDSLGLKRLEPILAERKRRAARGNTVNAALERLAKLCADRLQHDLKLYSSSIYPFAHDLFRKPVPT